MGPLGYGSGPVWVAGIMVGGAALFAGWGISQMVTDQDGLFSAGGGDTAIGGSQHPGQAGAQDGTVTVTLPDTDGNGVADALEDTGSDEATQPGDDAAPGRGDEDAQGQDGSGKDASTPAETEPAPTTYHIAWGDTLSEISGETGVPVGVLVEVNNIQNPNLIYAGASLVIPPTG